MILSRIKVTLGCLDKWTKAVAELAFAIESPGKASGVVVRPEGVFLVRVMEIRPAVTQSFEAVVPQLERDEHARLRKQLETEFEAGDAERYPVEWLE